MDLRETIMRALRRSLKYSLLALAAYGAGAFLLCGGTAWLVWQSEIAWRHWPPVWKWLAAAPLFGIYALAAAAYAAFAAGLESLGALAAKAEEIIAAVYDIVAEAVLGRIAQCARAEDLYAAVAEVLLRVRVAARGGLPLLAAMAFLLSAAALKEELFSRIRRAAVAGVIRPAAVFAGRMAVAGGALAAFRLNAMLLRLFAHTALGLLLILPFALIWLGAALSRL
ncbi:MAG: hypothetical protein WC421_04335 [Elusimicrobiales bacterium]